MSLLRQRATECERRIDLESLEPGARPGAVGQGHEVRLGRGAERAGIPGEGGRRDGQREHRHRGEERGDGQRPSGGSGETASGWEQPCEQRLRAGPVGVGPGVAVTVGWGWLGVLGAMVPGRRAPRYRRVWANAGPCGPVRCGLLRSVADAESEGAWAAARAVRRVVACVDARGRIAAHQARSCAPDDRGWQRSRPAPRPPSAHGRRGCPPAILPSLVPPRGAGPPRTSTAVALAQWQSIGLWLRRLRVRAP